MEKVFLIIVSQEFEKANHRDLWIELGRYGKTIIVDIPADAFVSIFKGKIYRIRQSHNPMLNVAENVFVIRPFFLIRPELLNNLFDPLLAKLVYRKLNKELPMLKDNKINVIIYNPRWFRIMEALKKIYNMKFAYYVFDEFRFDAHNSAINKKREVVDEYNCKKSDIIFAMSDMIAYARKNLNENIYVIGNGANYNFANARSDAHIKNSVAFIGNFRNWIDNDLLEELIAKRKDLIFCFVGNVEKNMEPFFRRILNQYPNVIYGGVSDKDNIANIYKMVDCVIVPYKKNAFISATRPIKIVESVISGTAVVTVPIAGYEENGFIKFASSVEQFSEKIDECIAKPIDKNDEDYIAFIKQNTWSMKAEVINGIFEEEWKNAKEREGFS